MPSLSTRLAVAIWMIATPLLGQSGPRTLTELQLSLLGVRATVENTTPVVPKAVASGVRVAVRAGTQELTPAEVSRFLGSRPFRIEADLSGPGLMGTLSLPQAASAGAAVNALTLALPAIPVAGNYDLANIRIVADGQVLDVEPARITVRVIDQILVSNVITRPLTLDQIRERGIVLDGDDYLGFEFVLALRLDSEVVNFQFPVVFDRKGVNVPIPILPPPPPPREGVEYPLMVPVMLRGGGGGDDGGSGGEEIKLIDGTPVRIPALLVIPGQVGYLKQFFSAKLYVSNGAPDGSGLTVHDVRARIKLPPGPDGVPGTDDDPLALPDLVRDGMIITQPVEMEILGRGEDDEPGTSDDVHEFGPREQGEAEFLLRGEHEGYHAIDFDIDAVLEGLVSPDGVTRPIPVKGSAGGGVLVRNPYFDMTFTVPSVVRAWEPFSMFVTVTNIGQAAANLFSLKLDGDGMSGVHMDTDHGEDGREDVATLHPRDSVTFEFKFVAERTGQVIAKYLKLTGSDATGSRGTLQFTLGVGERGVPLSPDTLALPASVDKLPAEVVQKAMRVLGQAWSIAKAPAGSLPSGVRSISPPAVVKKALALAEAGLRTSFGQPKNDAVRDVLLDFYGGQDGVDEGFDQLLRETAAGRDFADALGLQLAQAAGSDLLGYEEGVAELAASGPDFVSFAVEMGQSRKADVALIDAAGRSTSLTADGGSRTSQVPSSALVPVGPADSSPLLGLVTRPAGAYVLELVGRQNGSASVSVTLPAGDGESFRRATLTGLELREGSRTMIGVDPQQPGRLLVSEDLDGNGVPDGPPSERPTATLSAQGPRLVAATVIGPETLAGASPFGLHAAVVFDRVVDPVTAGDLENYTMAQNAARFARRQLSGRMVFLALQAPEGPYISQRLQVGGMRDPRGHLGPSDEVELVSRITAPGGIVNGRVLNAEGTPVTEGLVAYLNTLDGSWDCSRPPTLSDFVEAQNEVGLAAVPLNGAGTFELRYVRQHSEGCPFYLVIKDPVSGAQRTASARVRGPGDRIVLDIVLLGRGSVQGTVRNRATGEPVAGARVTALSLDDHQEGRSGVADLQGHYSLSGLVVGPVTVHAARGAGAGFASGRIYRAGETATIDVGLDDGALDVGGKVERLEGGVLSPAAGALVVIFYDNVAINWQYADTAGRYNFRRVPSGHFVVTAQYGSLFERLEGNAVAGQNVINHNLLLHVLPPPNVRDVVGHVFRADGQPATNAVVWYSPTGGTLAGQDGSFTLRNVPIPANPGTPTGLFARSADGLRNGGAAVYLSTIGQVPADVHITLSGVGQAVFTVLGPNGQSLSGVEVRRLGCANPCGCWPQTSDASGVVTFAGLPVGGVWVQAIKDNITWKDYASASATITEDGGTGFGILRFKGAGTVKVMVVDQDTPPQPVGASHVSLTANVFKYDPYQSLCGLAQGTLTQTTSITSGTPGEVEFRNVLLGGHSVSATNPNAPGAVVGDRGTLTFPGEVKSYRLQVVDRMAGILSGTISAADGTPAGPGVRVSVTGPVPEVTVTTNSESHYAFARVLPAAGYQIKAEDPDPLRGGVAQETLYLGAGRDVTFNMRLKGRGSVNVRVQDGNGQPVTAGQVKLAETTFPNGRYERVIQNAEGLAVFPRVWEGPFSVEVKDSFGRGGRASGVLPPGVGQSVDLTVRVTPTGCVSGRFLMPLPAGEPIPFGTVKLRGGPSMNVVGQVTTGSVSPDTGTFAFDYVPLGQVRLEAQDPLTARNGMASGLLNVEGHIPPDPNQPSPCLVLDVRAEGLGTVTGVVRSNGEPQEGIEVEVVSGAYRAKTFSSLGGLYRIEGVPTGLVTATARLTAGFLSGSASGVLAADGDTLTLDVALRDSVAVNGHLSKAGGGEPPVPVAEIKVSGPHIPPYYPIRGYSSSQGEFQFDRLPVGNSTLDADVLDSIDRGRVQVNLTRPPDGSPVDVSIALNGVGRLKGVARDSVGNPTSGSLTVSGTGDFPYGYYLTLGDTGEFDLSPILAGPVTLTLSARPGGQTLYGSATGTVPVDGMLETDVRLQDSGTVQGRVWRADGTTPAYGAEVSLYRPGTQVGFRATAAVDGTFVIRGVSLGAIRGQVRDPVTGGIAVLPERSVATNGEVVDYGTIVLDDQAPRLTFLEPAPGSSRAALAGPIVIDLGEGAENLDLSTFRLYYPNGAQGPADFVFENGRATAVSPYLVGLVIGSNRLRVSVKDASGNLGEAEVTFTVTGATIQGLVMAPGGQQVAVGASVQVGNLPPVLTDDQGHFVQGGLRPGVHSVKATDPQTLLPTAPLSVTVADGGIHPVELTLPAFGRIQGFVETQGGAPAEGVTVTTAGRSAVSNASGEFDLGALPLGTHQLLGSKPNGDRARESVTLSVLGATVQPLLKLNGIGALTVHVRDAGGADVTVAQVSVSSSSAFGGYYPGTTAAGGLVTFPQVLAGTLTVTASKNGLDGQETVLLQDGQTLTLPVQLEPAGQVEGRVTAAGTSVGVAGATVTLSGRTGSIATDSQGRYSFAGVPLGSITVDASTVEGDRARGTGYLSLPNQTLTVDLPLNGLGGVHVTVRDATGVVPGVRVALSSSSPFSSPREGASGTDGRVSFADVFAGTIVARAYRGNAQAVDTGVLTPGGSLALSPTFLSVGTITGHVLPPVTGQPVEGTRVRVEGLAGDVITGTDGAFVFENLALGTYRMEAYVNDRLRAFANGVVLATPAQTVTQDLTLVGVGRVTGTVSRSGAPVAASVTVQSQSAVGGSFPASSGSDGQYTVDLVPVGPFTIAAVAPNQDRADGSGTLSVDGQTVTVNLSLLPATVTLPRGLYDGNAVSWQVRSDGSLYTGSVFPGAGTTPRLSLIANGVGHIFSNQSGNSAATEENRREIVLANADLAGLAVQRKVFVPVDGYWVRYLDILQNPGAAAVVVDVTEEMDLGGTPGVVATASGDDTLTPADSWVLIDDADASDAYASGYYNGYTFAPLASVLWGPGATAPSEASFTPAGSQGLVRYRWNAVTVPAGGSVAILHLLSVQADRTRGRASAERLSQLPPEVLAGLTPAEAASVLNFDIPETLVSTLPPLPANDGQVVVPVRAFDGTTPVTASTTVRFRSLSPYYGRPLDASLSGSDFIVSGLPASGTVVPRSAFTVTASHTGMYPLTQQASASGDLSAGSPAQSQVVFAGTGMVQGVVQRANGNPVQGGSVRIAAWSANATAYPSADGFFRFPVVPPGGWTLSATHPLGGVTVTQPITVATDALTEQDLVYAATGALRVDVRTQVNAPTTASMVLSAVDFTRYGSAYASSGGTFTFAEVPPGSYTLTVTQSSSGAVVSRPVTVEVGVTQQEPITFPPVGSVRVVAHVGVAPLASAQVYIQADSRGTGFEYAGTTSPAGQLLIPSVPGPAFVVRVIHPNTPYQRGEAGGAITAEGPTVDVDVELPGVGSVSGVLRSRDGVPLPGTVNLRSGDGQTQYGAVNTLATGAFAFDNSVPVGSLRLRSSALLGGIRYESADVEGAVGGNGQTLALDALAPVGRLAVSGERQAWSFEAAAGTRVTIDLEGVAYGSATGLTDPYLEVRRSDGMLLVSNDNISATGLDARIQNWLVPATGSYLVVTRAAGEQTGGYGLRFSSGVVRQIALATITGQVRQGTDGPPLPGETVRTRLGGSVIDTRVTDATGYRFYVFAPGTYTLEALTADGVVAGSASASISALGVDVGADIVVPARGYATVSVQRASLGVAWLPVTLSSDHPTARIEDRTRVRTTDATGQIASVSLPVGTITARAIDPFTGVEHTASGTLAEGQTLPLTVSFPAEVSDIHGVVVARDGVTPLPGASVTLAGVGGTTTDAAGVYRFPDAHRGNHTLTATFGDASATRAFVAASPDVVQDVALPVAILRGHVTESDGAPAGGAAVQACGYLYYTWPYSEHVCVTTTTDAAGAYAFFGLPRWYVYPYAAGTGNVGVTASCADAAWPTSTGSFLFNANATATEIVDLELPTTGSLSGVVLDGGAPVSGATVIATTGAWTAPALTTDSSGQFALVRFPAGEARVYAAEPVDQIPGVARAMIVARQANSVTVNLLPTATLSGIRLDETGAASAGQVTLVAPAAPSPSPQRWTATVEAQADGSFVRRVPAGPWRATVGQANCPYGTVGAAEGSVAASQMDFAEVRLGTHVCRGFVGDSQTEFVASAVPTAEAYPPVASPQPGGQAFRSLRVFDGDVEVRTEQFTPASGQFRRTLTLFTNTGTEPATVDVESRLKFADGVRTIGVTSNGDAIWDLTDTYVVAVDDNGGHNDVAVVLGDLLAATSTNFDGGQYGEGGPEPGSLMARHQVLVPPGQTRGFLSFTLQAPAGGGTAAARAQALATLTGSEALFGLSEAERASIVNFTLPVLVSVSGRVELGASPVAAARVGALDASGALVVETTADGGGRFTLADLRAGDYTVVAVEPGTERPGRRSVTLANTPLEMGALDLLLDFELATVTLQVAGPGSYVGTAVEFLAPGWSPVWRPLGTLDASHQFTQARVPATPATQIIASTSLGAATGEATQGGTLTLTLTVGSGAASVFGYVREEDGRAVLGARVFAKNDSQTPPVIVAETATNAGGRFVFAGLAPGDYGLVAVDPLTNRPGAGWVSVTSGAPLDAGVILLPAAYGTLQIQGVLEGSNAPAQGAVVSLPTVDWALPVWPGPVVLDANGQAEVRGVGVGYVAAESGVPPNYGWEDGTLEAGATLQLVMHIGQRARVPVNLTGDDGRSYVAWGDGGVSPSQNAWGPLQQDFVARGDARLMQGGREVMIGPRRQLSGVDVHRRVFVPQSGRFARVLDVVTNPTNGALSVPYRLFQSLPGAGATQSTAWELAATSDGDLEFTASDIYAVLSNAEPDRPALAYVLRGAGAVPQPYDAFEWYAPPNWTYRDWSTDWSALLVPPQSTVMVVQFVVQRSPGDTAAVETQAQALADLSDPEALTGLTPEEKASIVNFVVPPGLLGGLPQVGLGDKARLQPGENTSRRLRPRRRPEQEVGR